MRVVKLLAAAAIAVVLLFAIGFAWFYLQLSPIKRGILSDQSWLLYHVNHEILAKETRRFGKQQRSLDISPQTFKGDDPRLPPSLGILKPSSVDIVDGYVRIEFGGFFLRYGLYVYDEGLAGPGTKEVLEGVWFYSENGRYPGPNGEKRKGPPSGH